MFAGAARAVTVVWHNASQQTAEADISARLIQTTSATAVRIGETPWKVLRVLPQQTVIESAAVDFPAVKAETKFVVQWFAGTNEMWAKPTCWCIPPTCWRS